jgi:hypothetical protein
MAACASNLTKNMLRFVRKFALLLVLPAILTKAQAVSASGPLTPESLTQLCAGKDACEVNLTGHSTLALAGDWRLPAAVHLRFAPASSLSVSGGILDFAGGSIDAPAEGVLFSTPARVRGLSVSRPEWFGDAAPGQPVPAAALASAYEATVPWGTLYLQNRSYVSPFICLAGYSAFLSPRTLVGFQRPVPDDPENPSRLVGGTVLLGGIGGSGPIKLAHLGIDAGPVAATSVLGGCRPPAIFLPHPGREFLHGDRLEDVSILSTGAKNMHSVMFEGHLGVQIHGLWIWTLGGTHGLVLKSGDSVVDDFHCRGAASDCLIVKSDYATNFQGRAVHNRISHVDIAPLKPGGVVGGIVVESKWDTVRDLELSDIHEEGAYYGVSLLGSFFYQPHGILVRNWKAENMTGPCLLSTPSIGLTVSGFECDVKPGLLGFWLWGGRQAHFEHGTLRCTGDRAACAAGRADAINDDAAGTVLEDVTAEDFGGFLLRSTRDSPSALKNSHVVGMDGRLFARQTVPAAARVRVLLEQMKPNAGILYAAVATRVYQSPHFYCSAAILGLTGLLGVVFLVRRRRKHSTAQLS